MSDVDLVSTWRAQLDAQEPGLHLADPFHPLEMYVGATDSGYPRFVIRSGAKPTRPALSDIVLVERHEDSTHRWNLVFTLQDRKFIEVFLRLVEDCHGRSFASPTEAVALDRVSVVIDEWRRLMQPRHTGRLSMEELRGLVGETWLMVNRFSSSRSIEATVLGWLGPLGLPQDFWYAEDGFHEAKSIGPSASWIRVSSEHQLDQEGLELIVLRVANTDDLAVGAVNLVTLVSHLASGLLAEGVGRELLDERLTRLGVDLTDPFYHETWFAVPSLSTYDVGPDFPAIRATRLPPGVGRVTYQLSLADLAEFLSEGPGDSE